MSEHQQARFEQMRKFRVNVLAQLLLHLSLLDPRESSCREVEGGKMLWGATVVIDDEAIDAAIDHEPRSEPLELELEFYRADLIGHWVITGMDEEPGKAFQFGDAHGADWALAQASDYMAGEV